MHEDTKELMLTIASIISFFIAIVILVLVALSNNKDDYIKTCIEATDLTHVQCEFEYMNKDRGL